MLIKLYAYYGVLTHEKEAVYADYLILDHGVCHEEMDVEFPDFDSSWYQNGPGHWIFSPDKGETLCMLNDCLVDASGVPAIRFLKYGEWKIVKGRIIAES